jgi:hypothetical protein
MNMMSIYFSGSLRGDRWLKVKGVKVGRYRWKRPGRGRWKIGYCRWGGKVKGRGGCVDEIAVNKFKIDLRLIE